MQILQDRDGIATLNPFRYRSYYFDEETNLYYLQTRYYDPEIGRFINADSIEYIDPETLGGLNLYVYCGNNPVMGVDPNGTVVSFLVGLGIAALIGAIVGAASYAVSEVISYTITGNWTWTWGGFLGSVVSGAIVGAFSFAVPEVAIGWCAAINGYLSTSLGMLFENAFGEANNTGEEILIASFSSAVISGTLSGLTSKIKLPGFTGRGSITQVHKQIFTKFTNGTISKIKGKTFGKLLAYELGYNFFSTIANGIVGAIKTIEYIRKLNIPSFAPNN